MVTNRQALVGGNVYKGFSKSANMGQVSSKGAQGYLQRELRKPARPQRPVGNDGKSDRRSGVASRALGNIKGNLGNNIGRSKASGNSVKGAPSKSSGLPQNKPAAVNTPVGAVAAPPQQVTVNPVGQLQLPYDSTLSLDALTAQKEHDDALYQLQLEEQQMLAEVTQGRRDADLNFKNMSQFNLDANAASGTAYSSQYGKAVADTATAHSNTLSDLQRRESDFTQQAAGRRAAIAGTLSTQLAAATQAYQERAAAEAASLASMAPEPEAAPETAPEADKGGRDKHKYVPTSKNQPKCKVCGKWRDTSVHTNRG